MPEGVVVVVDDGTDALAADAARALRAAGTPVRPIAAGDLARAPLELTATTARLDGSEVGAVLFRAGWRSWLAEGFEEQDADFCSSETVAAWLSLLDLESVLAINRSDPELWFSSAEWPVWRRRLEQAGVPVTPLEIGEASGADDRHWLPWGGGVARQPGARAARCLAAALSAQPAKATTLWLDG